MYRKITKFVTILSSVLLNVGMVLMGCAMILVFIQTVLRYSFSINFEWIEEITRYLIIITAFSLCGYVTYNNGHVSLSVVYDTIKNEKARKIMDIIGTLLSTFLGCLVLKWATDVFINAGTQVTLSQLFPMRLPYSFLPVGMLILILFAVLKTIVLIMELTGTASPEAQKQEDPGTLS